MIYIIGIAITFFLSFILLTKNGKSSADKILAVWLCFIGLHLTLFYLYLNVTQKQLQFPHLLGLEIPLPLLHGPFLFLYTTSLTEPKQADRKQLLHFVPYLVGMMSVIPFLSLPAAEKISVYEQEGKGYAILTGIIFVSVIISGLVYSLLSLRYLRQYHRRILEMYSYTEKINLKWLYFLNLGLAIVWILVIVANDTHIFTAVVLYVLFIGYYGIKQVGIFTNQSPYTLSETPEGEVEVVEAKTEQSGKAKYGKSELAPEQLKEIHEMLACVIHQEKLYQTPELTLSDVAKRLDVHPNTLSQAINRIEQKNFFDYINGLRVDEFKERITKAENQQFTMLSVAYDCGFNSKTSFNRNFKRATGMSPKEYLEKARL